MKIQRTANATRNFVFGLILKLYQIIIPFIMRTVMIYYMGVEYLGLSSLFTSILEVLNLAELGIGAAMVYSMYKPIAEDDEDQVCALLNLYKKYYRCIGIVILIAGLVILPFIPYLVKSDIPSELNIYLLYVLYLLSTVFTYWLYAYKNSLLQAFQRVDIISKVTLLTNTIQYVFQLIAILRFHNYYMYILSTLVLQIFNNIFTAFIVKRMYPQYKAQGKVAEVELRDIRSRIKDIFTSKIGAVMTYSVDTIVISSCLGLSALAVYQNYNYVLTSVTGIVSIIFTSCLAGVGNSIIVESKEKNFRDLKKLSMLITCICSVGVCCFLSLYQPFMKIWVGNKLLLPYAAVVLFSIRFITFEFNQLFIMFKDAAGIWHEDRFRALLTAIANLILDLIFVKYWGTIGVIFATVFSELFIGIPWIIYNIFSTLFTERHQLKEYIVKMLGWVLKIAIIAVITTYFTNLLPDQGIIMLLVKAIVTIIISSIFLFLFNFKSVEFKEMLLLLKNIKGKFYKGK